MAKAKNPINISQQFKVSPDDLERVDVINSTLAVDTKLFIDPLLLAKSKHPEMNKKAVEEYKQHFEKVISLLEASAAQHDVAWRAANRLFQFPEIQGTCLGYGAGSIHGSGFGEKLTNKILKVAKEIIDIGVKNPDLFTALALFESEVGPDRVSDMTTNIIFDSLSEFNARILNELNLSATYFRIGGKDRAFLKNPFEKKETPVILVPKDILRSLPTANDWDSVAAAARENKELREKINSDIGEIWAAKTKRDKEKLKAQAIKSKEAFNTLLDTIKSANTKPYDIGLDPDGVLIWSQVGIEFANKNPFSFEQKSVTNLDEAFKVVKEIVNQFRHLIEKCGLNKELYTVKNKPRHESTSQRIFFAVAHSYCKANNIDISPEIDTGNGKVDFKFSTGFNERILVEIKLSTNTKIKSGYSAQLEEYKIAQQTMKAIYLVIDVGKMGNKDKDLIKIRNDAAVKKDPLSELEFVDATPKISASKRK
jgi:hypothetical protein